MSVQEEEEPEFTAQQQEWMVATQVQAAIPTTSPDSSVYQASGAAQSSTVLPGTSSGTLTVSTAAIGNTGESYVYRTYTAYNVLAAQGLWYALAGSWASETLCRWSGRPQGVDGRHKEGQFNSHSYNESHSRGM